MSSEIKSVGSELLEEIQRCGGIMRSYESIRNMPGVFTGFAEAMIKQALDVAKKAMADGDAIACIRSLEELRGFKD